MNETSLRGRQGCKRTPKQRKRGIPFDFSHFRSRSPLLVCFFLIINPLVVDSAKYGQRMFNPLSIFLFPYYCFFPYHCLCGVAGVSRLCAPGSRVLPGYKPTNGVLTAAALLHCRRAETNRIQRLRCARLPFLSRWVFVTLEKMSAIIKYILKS